MTTAIERKLFIYLGIIFTTLIILVFLVYKGVQSMTASGDLVTHTLQVKESIKELQSQINKAGEVGREYFITGEPELLTTYARVKESLDSQTTVIRNLLGDNLSQLQRLDSLNDLIEKRLELLGLIMSARRQENFDLGTGILRGAELRENKNEVTRIFRQMESEEQALYVERSERETSNARLAAAIAVIGILIATASLALTGVGMRRGIALQMEGEQKLRERERELSLALGSSNAGLWFWDLTNNQVHWSDDNCHVFGIDPASCKPTYEMWMGCLHSEDRERIERELETALREKRNFKTEHRIVWPNGEIHRLLVKGQAKYDASGKPVRMSGICLDITELRQTEDALYESEERFRLIAEYIEAVLWIRNAETKKIEFVSSGSQKLWNIKAEALMSGEVNWSSFIHPHDVDAARDFARASSFEEPLDQEYRIITPGGDERWVRDRAFPVKDRNGIVRRIVGFTVDTTERKQAEELKARLLSREQDAREQAETANRTKDEFLAIVSHELRSPLNAMLGWARVLRSETVDQQTHDHAIQVIEQSAEMQSRLIEDLLDLARIASGNVRIESHPVNLIPVIQSAMDTVYAIAEDKGVELQTRLDSNAGLITGDSERLQQIVWNLLSNAVKFTPKGGKVDVELKREGSRVLIIVQDTGKGIRPEEIPFIFERFRQADSSSTRRAGGLGLGLSVVKSLVGLHGGTIGAESEGAGKGSIFTVSLPLRALAGSIPAAPTPEVKRQPGRTTGQLSFPPVLTGLNILTVDDEAQTRDLVAVLLTRYGASVTTASSSAEAIDILTVDSDNSKFDLIVSDIGMPEEDGYTMIRRIRHLSSPIGKIPAVALTAFGRAEDRINALESGFQMHVPKPVEPTELMMVIASLTGRTVKKPIEKI